jgi:hypothetical protein
LAAPRAPGAVDQDLPHRSRRNRHEVIAVLPDGRCVGEAEIRFVDQRGRLQRLARSLASQVRGSKAFQFGIDLIGQGRGFTWIGRGHHGTIRRPIIT